MSDSETIEPLCDTLRALQTHLTQALRSAARAEPARDWAALSRITPDDRLYAVDTTVEATLVPWLRAHWPEHQPTEVVLEGWSGDAPLTVPVDCPPEQCRWRLLLDPVDGTRGWMYGKRSAWSLAGLAPQRGNATPLRACVCAVMTELPGPKQDWVDQLSAVHGGRREARRWHIEKPHNTRPWAPQPLTGASLAHRFGSVVRFLPGQEDAAARLEAALWAGLQTAGLCGEAQVFFDQYLSSGGQLYGLIAGQDAFVADLRPLLPGAPENFLYAHPYDLVTLSIAEAWGVVVEHPLTREPLDAPMDTQTPVAWAGYANRALADAIGPVLQRRLQAL